MIYQIDVDYIKQFPGEKQFWRTNEKCVDLRHRENTSFGHALVNFSIIESFHGILNKFYDIAHLYGLSKAVSWE